MKLLDLVFKGIGSEFFCENMETKDYFQNQELNNTGLNFEPLSTLIIYK